MHNKRRLFCASKAWERFRMNRESVTAIVFIVSLNLIVYWSKVFGQFIADDFDWLKLADQFAVSPKNLLTLGLLPAYFRPIPLLIWIFLYKLSGCSPLLYHVVSLLLHCSNSILVFLLLRKIFQGNTALISACVFSIFTGHLEAVQWLSCLIGDMFCVFFFLLSLLTAIYFFQSQRLWLYLVSLFLATLSLLSKESAIVLPAVIFLVLLVCSSINGFQLRTFFSLSLLILPYLLLYAIYLLIRIRVLGAYGVQAPDVASFIGPKILLNYWDLFGNLVFPFAKTAAMEKSLPLATAALLILIAILFHRKRETRIGIAFGLLWILITALPTISSPPPGHFFSRWNYLPSIGFSLAVTQIITISPQWLREKRLSGLLACLVLAAYSINTIFHNHIYIKAWQTSKRVQESFMKDVKPLLKRPARAYFFGVPEFADGIPYFAVGLPSCFSVLNRERGVSYYPALNWTHPKVWSPENNIPKESACNYYLFQWDSVQGIFTQVSPQFQESEPSGSEADVLYRWDFSRYADFVQWEPAHELALLYGKREKSYKFITTGDSSLLKSPFFNQRLKYIQLVYQATNPSSVALSGQLFWITGTDTLYDGKKSLVFPVKNDGLVHIYTLPLYINGWSLREPLCRLGLRLSDQPGTTIKMHSVILYSY